MKTVTKEMMMMMMTFFSDWNQLGKWSSWVWSNWWERWSVRRSWRGRQSWRNWWKIWFSSRLTSQSQLCHNDVQFLFPLSFFIIHHVINSLRKIVIFHVTNLPKPRFNWNSLSIAMIQYLWRKSFIIAAQTQKMMQRITISSARRGGWLTGLDFSYFLLQFSILTR